MTKPYIQTHAEHLRLTILLLLSEEPDYALNESMLADLLAPFGFAPSRDQLRTELAWLEEQRAIRLEDVADLKVAHVTKRGQDVALGRATVPGIRHPGPR